MEEQIVQAVGLAAQAAPVDAELRTQALEFINQLQASPQAAWSAGWNVFATDAHPLLARIFGLTLVTSFLGTADPEDPSTQAATSYLHQALLTHVHASYVAAAAPPDLSLAGKLAQTTTHLISQSYAQPQPSTLLPDLFSLLYAAPADDASSAPPLNALVADLVLKVLHDLSLSLGSDVSIRAAKDRTELVRDNQVKDAIRIQHATALAEQVTVVAEAALVQVSERVQRGVPVPTPHDPALQSRALNDANAVGVLRQALICLGDYASWLDISLMVTPRTIELLLRALHLPYADTRCAAAEALLEIIFKGMKPVDKQQLLTLLALTPTLARLEQETRSAGTHAQILSLGLDRHASPSFTPLPQADGPENSEFRQRLAKLVDGITLELSKILDEATPTGATDQDPSVLITTRQAAAEMLQQHFPLVLILLADEDDGPSEQVIQCVYSVLNVFKKLKRRSDPDAALVLSQQGVLDKLMSVVCQKLKYDVAHEWTGLGSADDTGDIEDEEDPDSDEAAFHQLRKALQQIAASIAGLDVDLFSRSMQNVIIGTLSRYEDSIKSGGTVPLPSWQDLEVALHTTFFFGEILVSHASPVSRTGLTSLSFVETDSVMPAPVAGAKRAVQPRLTGEQLRSLPLSFLGQTIERVLLSGVADFDHPAVQLQLLECMVRYSAFFTVRPNLLQEALTYFLDTRGIHRAQPGYRKRANYLFTRFVRETRTSIALDMVPTILENTLDVLAIHAVLPVAAEGEDVLALATERVGAFESQLHLFDAVGTLLALFIHEPDRLTTLLSLIVSPLAQNLTEALQGFEASGHKDLRLVLQVHHVILAMSTLAKGFPDANQQTASAVPAQNGSVTLEAWIEAFKAITEQIMTAVSALRPFRIIREAGRGAFSRIINTIGRHALPFIPVLIDAVLSELSAEEVMDSLTFLTMLVNKYKQDLRTVLDGIFLVLLERTFFFLNQPVTGTDESLERASLQKAYTTFISNLFSADLGDILVSESTYFANMKAPDFSLTSVCFTENNGQLHPILQSLVFYAGNGIDKSVQRSALVTLSNIVLAWGATMDGFQTFCYDTLVPLVFETPAKPSIDLADAQTQQVLLDLAGLAKRLYATRGDELLAFLVSGYFPSIHCPADLATDMAHGLKTLDSKAYRKLLTKFAQASTGAPA